MKKLPLFFVFTILLSSAMFMGCADDDENSNPTSPSKSHRALTDQIQAEFEAFVHDTFQVAGAVIGIKFTDDGEIWIGTTGEANKEFAVDVQYDDRYKIGSFSKCFVAHRLLQLVDDGQIDLDTPAINYLPATIGTFDIDGFFAEVDPDSQITVRMMAQHTSGIINYNVTNAFQTVYYANPFRAWGRDELLFYSQGDLTFPAGSAWSYSNTGYIYIGIMIETLTGNKLGDEIQQHVFGPLGLTGTTFDDPNNSIPMVEAYLDINQNRVYDLLFEVVTGATPTQAWAAGAIVSTATDMIRYLEALVDGELLTAAAQAERLNYYPMPFPNTSYGIGLVNENGALGHVGGIEGFTTAAFQDEFGNSIAVMVNGSTPIDPAILEARWHNDNNVAHHIFQRIRPIIAEASTASVEVAESITPAAGYGEYLRDFNTR